jgi:hypothetical protein
MCADLVPDGCFVNPLIGDGFCNGGPFMSEACGNDGRDCNAFVKEFPNCPTNVLVASNEFSSKPSIIIGDGVDNDNAKIINSYTIICDSTVYMPEACGCEDGDCYFCVNQIPSGTENFVGDGFCNCGAFSSIASPWFLP